jgi:multiple sugar transport system permease protein
MKKKTSVGTWIGLIVILVWCLRPVAWIVSLSFKSLDETSVGSPHFLPQDFTWDNYQVLLGMNDDKTTSFYFLASLRNSLGISIIATILAVLIATLAAYAIARLEFRGKRLVLSLALAIAMFPVVSLVGPLFDMWRTFHLFNTWPGLIIPYMTFTLPLAIWTLSAFFREIPWDLEKAAQMDGATGAQAFRRVILPLAMPGVFTAGILTFIAAWNDFLFANVLTATDTSRTAPVALSYFRGASQFTDPSGAIAAGAVVVTIPILIMVLIFQRRIVSGLTSGAVKG